MTTQYLTQKNKLKKKMKNKEKNIENQGKIINNISGKNIDRCSETDYNNRKNTRYDCEKEKRRWITLCTHHWSANIALILLKIRKARPLI